MSEGIIIKPTTVISVRGRNRLELKADPDFVYVGRSMPRQGWRNLGWGNPYPFKVYSDAADRFGSDLRAVVLWGLRPHRGEIEGMAKRIGELKGKTLGCWCGSWSPGQPDIGCHAVSLAVMANSLCPMCGKAGRTMTSLGVCPWCDDTQGETPDPESELGKFLANRERIESA